MWLCTQEINQNCTYFTTHFIQPSVRPSIHPPANPPAATMRRIPVTRLLAKKWKLNMWRRWRQRRLKIAGILMLFFSPLLLSYYYLVCQTHKSNRQTHDSEPHMYLIVSSIAGFLQIDQRRNSNAKSLSLLNTKYHINATLCCYASVLHSYRYTRPLIIIDRRAHSP